MTNYEKIKKIIEAGHMALVQKNNGEMMIAYAISNFGNLLCTNWQTEMNSLWNGDHITLDKGYMDQPFWKYVSITVYQPPLHYYNPGDMVEILPSVLENRYHEEFKNQLASMVGCMFVVHRDTGELVNIVIDGKTEHERHINLGHRNIAPEYMTMNQKKTLGYEKK